MENTNKELRERMDDVLVKKMAENLGANEPKKEPPLTRQQIRFKERMESEAASQLNAFISRYYEFFMDNAPESEEVTKKRKELSAKWKMYCKRKNFMPSALPLFDTAAQKIVDQFNDQLKETV